MQRDFLRATLKQRHRPVIRALAEAMFVDAATSPKSRLDAFVDDVDSYVSHASKALRLGLLVMLELIRFTPALLLWRFATFDSLPCEDRVRVLERMETSRIALFTLVFIAYKSILTLIYFEHPDALAAMGYSDERRTWLRILPAALSEAAE